MTPTDNKGSEGAKAKNKAVLKDIAKLWCKGVLVASEAAISFEVLTIEEQDYLQEQIILIANRITDKKAASNVNELLNEYFE